MHSASRQSTMKETIRTAMAVEASGLRYVNLIRMNGAEESLARGWDLGVDMEDDDGT
eukprot:CAMPEP_0197840104 /NCGR_PEP_ID=MMETSP1437-20131217/45411_1 /TAXON_ID=49252 ORGANISM="Eucampia antarctica, Strain CCMP1452" /NCGR_SAMPLE_ID=MMETSP1437 /ASSEMBLY_ACC=CAM_ASM_001096 /LENGTH=56 /DNA_ID=CAMNT_0043449655 /DNA_START=127 /DNA_END=297 /DNA_ORIENTATION=-